MKFTEIYNRTISLWGNEVVFDDGIMIESKQSFKAPWKKSGPSEYFHSGKLSSLWNEAEEKVKQASEYEKQMVWAQYQVFYKLIVKLASENIFTLVPGEVERKLIEEQFFTILSEPGFEEELKVYERDI